MTRNDLKRAREILNIRGWTYVGTVMHDGDGPARGQNYGLLYSKGTENFWLNQETFRKLPE